MSTSLVTVVVKKDFKENGMTYKKGSKLRLTADVAADWEKAGRVDGPGDPPAPTPEAAEA